MSSVLSGPSTAPTAAIGNVVVAGQTSSVDAEQSVATLAAEIDLVRRELYLGYWQEATETLDRVRKRFAKAAESATTWSSDDSMRLRVMRAVSYTLQGRAEDTREARADWLFGRANDLFTQMTSTTPAPELSDEERTDWAVTLAHLGQFDAALRELPATKSSDAAAWADVMCEFGRAYGKAGLIRDALEYLERAVKLDPGDPRSQEELGAVLGAMGESRRAAAAFRAAAVVLERGGRFREALTQIDSSLAADPGVVENNVMKIQLLRALERHHEAMLQVETALISAPDSPALLREQVLLLLSSERYQEALEVADRGSQRHDGSADLQLLRVSALVGLRELPTALEAARIAVADEPGKPEVHSTEAHVLRALEDEQGALAAIERTIELNRWDADAHVMRASILRQAGRLPEAIASAEEAVNLAPDDAEANLELGLSLVVAERWGEALPALRTASSARAEQALPLALVGYAQAKLGHADKAIKKLRKATRLDPELIWARDQLVELLLPDLPGELERAEEALQIVEETIARAPADGPAKERARRLMLRGEALRVLGRHDEALTSLREARALDFESVDIAGTIGQVLNSLGRWQEAVEILNAATENRVPPPWIVLALVEALAEQDPHAAVEAIANTQDRGLDRETAVLLLDRLLNEAGPALQALDDVLLQRGAWDAGVAVRALHAVALDQEADYARLLTEVQDVLAQNPDWNTGRDAKLQLLRALGRTEEALELIDSTLALNPHNETFLRSKFELLAAAGQSGPAEQFLREVIEREGTEVWAFEALGRMLSDAGRHEDALGLFNHVLGVTGDERIVAAAVEVLRRLDQGEEALAIVQRALARNPESVWLHTTMAEQLWLLDRTEEALKAVERGLDLDPFNLMARGLSGALLSDLGRPIAALTAFDRVLEQGALPPWALARHGFCLSEIGEFEEAIPSLDVAVSAYEGHSWLLSLRAWCHQHAGDLGAALADYEAVVAADGDLWARKSAATCLSLIEDRRPEATARFLDILDRLKAESGMTTGDRHSLEGWCLFRLGELDAAVEALTRSIAADPLSAPVQLDLALAMLCRGDGRKARAEYERGIELARNTRSRGASQLRVALIDLENAQRERPDVAHGDAFVKVHRRLDTSTAEAREANAHERAGAQVEVGAPVETPTEELQIVGLD